MARPTKSDDMSTAGKMLRVEEHVELLVVGAGPAGLSTAIEAAGRGMSVVLVDENPVSIKTMGDEVPLHFGQGMSGAVRNRNAVMDVFVASEPLIEAAFEAGVDLRLGTACWGLYADGPGARWLPGTVAGLCADGRAWLTEADHVVVAAGRRDMGLAFPGWDKPGVMGATAAVALATRYDALAPRRVVVLGTTTEALIAVKALQRSGVEVAAIVENAAAPVGPVELLPDPSGPGCEILSGHVVREALGADGVEAVLVAGVDETGTAVSGERRIECDGVVLAVGVTPVVDLLASIGCSLAFQPGRGGYAPLVDAHQRTSVPNVFAVGDCAGIWPAKSRDRAIAEQEGRSAIAAITAPRTSQAGEDAFALPVPDGATLDYGAYRLGWVRASVVNAREDVHVCQCEEVTARDILEVRPPRYLDWRDERRSERSLASLLGEGPPNPDQVKRLTRAGMGPCQGRRCREQVAALLALEAGTSLDQVPLAGYRAPVRPLPLAVAAQLPEGDEMARHWDVWFGIHAQWRPVWEQPEFFTVATNDTSGEAASE